MLVPRHRIISASVNPVNPILPRDGVLVRRPTTTATRFDQEVVVVVVDPSEIMTTTTA